MRRYVFIVIALVILSGCGIGNRTIKMSINPIYNNNVDIFQYKKFVVAYLDNDNQLVEQNLANSCVRELTNMGYLYDNNSPDFIVAIFFNREEKTVYIPPSVSTVPKYIPGTTTYHSGNIYGYGGSSAWYSGNSFTTGTWTTEEQVYGGFDKTSVSRKMRIDFADAREVVNNKRVVLIWRSDADILFVEGPSKDRFERFGPYVIHEMMRDFPVKQRISSERSIRVPNSEID